jgi:threonine/homoserine/homoserine lactone efflux protein
MAHVAQLIALFAVDLVAAMTPGPNFVLVSQTAVRRSFHHGAAVVLGLMISNSRGAPLSCSA